MRIASRLEMHQFLGRFPSILPLAVRVARQIQPGYRVARPQHPLVFHPPIIQPLPRYRAVKQTSDPLIALWLPLVISDRLDQRGLPDAVIVPACHAPLNRPSRPAPQGASATLPYPILRCMSRPFSATLRLALGAENEKRSSCALHGFPEELEKLCQVSCDRSCLS